MKIMTSERSRTWRSRSLAATLAVVCCLADISQSTTPVAEIRGVAPRELSTYVDADGSSIRCLVGGVERQLPLDRVNDDYCDCDDGNDEHGTTACSHLLSSTFYCENGGYFTKHIPTSLLNDGICDCCDGSDEFDASAGAATCRNTCAEDAVEYREKAQQRLKEVESGFQKRQAALQGVVAAHFDNAAGSEATIAQSLASLEALKARVEEYKALEERRERKMRLEEARSKQPVDPSDNAEVTDAKETAGSACVPNAETGETCAEPSAPTTDSESFEEVDAADIKAEILETDAATVTEDDEASDVKAASDDSDASVRRVRAMIELSDGTKVSLADYLRMQHQAPRKTFKGSRSVDEMRRKDFLGPLFNGKEEDRKRMGLYALRGVGLLLSPVRLVVEIVLYVPRLLSNIAASSETLAPYVEQLPSIHSVTDSPSFRRLAGGAVYRTYRDVAWGSGVVWDVPVYAYNYLFPHVDDQLTLPEAESLRQVLKEIEDDIRKLESDRDAQRRDLSFDYGPDRAFFALKEECIEKTVEKYVYRLCPFNNVQQDFTSMGRWDAWGTRDGNSAGDGAKDYSVMQFTHGQRCWNGPERSVRVTWRCGESNEIVSVDEPSTCVYEMVAQSYLACTADVVESAKQDVAFWGK